jgi:type IV pilus assembly protein PilN
MRITLNLASKPFIELRPLYARLRWLMAILLLAAIPLWFLVRTEQRKAALANAKLQAVEDSIQRLQDQQNRYQAMMRQPQNAAVLTQAAFLNRLFAQKAFSWTAVMMDLETVLPAGVQVMNIDPEIDKSGAVTIRLRVNGQRDRAVDLVRNLEHSRRFLQPRLASEALETTTTGNQANFQAANGPSNVNFDVLAEYNPLTAHEAAKTADKKAPADGESSVAKPETRSTPPGPAARHKHAPQLAPLAPPRPQSRPRTSPQGAQ